VADVFHTNLKAMSGLGRSRFLVGALFAMALSGWSSRATGEPLEDDYYTDPTGKRAAFTPVYEGWFGSDRYPTRYWRAAWENLAVSGLELAIYWYDWDSIVVDWQFPDVGTKLTSREAFRLDDNLLQTNYLFHSFAGGTHYVVSRTNGFGVLGAWATTAASSALYELVLEWKEIVSFNDLITTPFGGMAMGEFFHQLGNYLNSQPPQVDHVGLETVAHETSLILVAGPNQLHDALDDEKPPPPVYADNLGLSSAYHHRFRVLLGRDLIEDDRGRSGAVFSTDGKFELAAMPGFQRAGKFSLWYTNGNFTSFDARLAYGLGAPGYGGSARNVELTFDSHLVGWYEQDFEPTADGLRGQAHEVAVATGLRYAERWLLGRNDHYGIVHLPHPVQRTWIALGPAKVRLGVEVSPDFGSLYSAAFETYAFRYGREGTKSSLKRHGYFHGWGLSAGASAALIAGGFELGADARYGRYESIDGVERVQEEVTREPHGREAVTELEAHLAFEPRGVAVATQIELSQSIRSSALAAIETLRFTRRLTFGLGAHF
jgi:hypothetical protein